MGNKGAMWFLGEGVSACSVVNGCLRWKVGGKEKTQENFLRFCIPIVWECGDWRLLKRLDVALARPDTDDGF